MDSWKLLNTDYVRAVATNADASRVYSGSDDKIVKMWNVVSEECLRTLEGHSDHVYDVCVSADGQTLFSGSSDKTAGVWNLESGELVRQLEGHTYIVVSVCCFLDGKRVVSGSDDKTLKVWDSSTSECLNTLPGHTDWMRSVDVSSNNNICSASDDGTIRLWNANADVKASIASNAGHTRAVVWVQFNNLGNRILSYSNNNEYCVWNCDDGGCIHNSKQEPPVDVFDRKNARDIIKMNEHCRLFGKTNIAFSGDVRTDRSVCLYKDDDGRFVRACYLDDTKLHILQLHRVVKAFTKVLGSLAQTLYGSLFKLPTHSSISSMTDTVTISSSDVGTRHSNTKWEELDRWVRSSSLRTALCLRRSWLASFCTFPAQVHRPKLKFVVL